MFRLNKFIITKKIPLLLERIIIKNNYLVCLFNFRSGRKKQLNSRNLKSRTWSGFFLPFDILKRKIAASLNYSVGLISSKQLSLNKYSFCKMRTERRPAPLPPHRNGLPNDRSSASSPAWQINYILCLANLGKYFTRRATNERRRRKLMRNLIWIFNFIGIFLTLY